MKIGSDNMKSWLKSSVSRGLYSSGLFELMKYHKLRNKGFILMYHRILRSKGDSEFPIQPGMYVTCATFEKHLRYLKKTMHIIPLDELVDRMQTGLSLTRCCSITFDDGWHDNYIHAFPLLKKYSVPATVFLATGYIGTDKWFWPEELSWCFSKALHRISHKDAMPETIQILLSNVTYKENDTMGVLIERAIDMVKHFRPEVRKNIMNQLRISYPRDEEQRLLMNWDEAMEMYKDGLVSFGAHTVNHHLLDELDIESMRREVLDSQKQISMNLGFNTKLFAYPNGNYTSNIVKLLQENAFRGAVTTKKGFIEYDTPQMAMPRIGMHDDVSCSTARFVSRILMKQF